MCRENYSGNKGKISSPNYPAHYNSNSDCMYKIEVPSGMRIKIRFHKFVTESAWGGMLGKEMRINLWCHTVVNLELIYQKYYRCIWHDSTSPTFCLYCTGSCYDYVEAHDGSSGSDPSLGRFCGTLRPFTLLSSSNVMLVRFVSDDSQNFGGFQFTYSAEGTVNAWKCLTRLGTRWFSITW